MDTNGIDSDIPKKHKVISQGHSLSTDDDLEDGFIVSGKGRADENLVPEGDEGADFLSRATESGNDHEGVLKDIEDNEMY